MNTSVLTSAPSVAPREVRRLDAPFVPAARISGRTAIWCFLLGVGIMSPLAQLIGWLDLPMWSKAVVTAQQRWTSYALHPEILFLRAVLIYPLLEEILYRGLILQLLRRYCPLWVAVGVSSAIFGIVHLPHGYGSALNAFVLGGVLAMLLVQTRSLFATILCHASINFTWLFLVTPSFGLLEGILKLDPSLPAQAQKLAPLPAWWLLLATALTIASGLMLRTFAGRRSSASAT